jgi:hypothetical protein
VDSHCSPPPVLALFQKRFDGDDALLELARVRFTQAGLGPEYYAETPQDLGALLGFRPGTDVPAAVHLPRDLDLLDPADRARITDFARACPGEVRSLVVHDQPELATRTGEYTAALGRLDAMLADLDAGPRLFVEYAALLPPDRFVGVFREISGLERISACLDVGHLGSRQVRIAYEQRHPGEDVCALKPGSPGLASLVDDVQQAVETALPAVLEVIRQMAALGGPLHFHLHDGHPLSTFSSLGLTDHVSFLASVSIPFTHRGQDALRPMFGPGGLAAILAEAAGALPADRLSFTLEIHPMGGRLPLGDAATLFRHWTDTGNAERMNEWLSILAANQRLVLASLEPASRSGDLP